MKEVQLKLGTPIAGWLPVELIIDDYQLSIEASDLGLNVIDQLYDLMINIQNRKPSECYFYLEPAAYFLKIKQNENSIFLQIDYSDDFDIKENQLLEKQLYCEIDSQSFYTQIKMCITSFIKQTYSSDDWPVPNRNIELKHLIES